MQLAEIATSLAMAMSALAASTLSAGNVSRSMSRKRYKACIGGKIAPFSRSGEPATGLASAIVDLHQVHGGRSGGLSCWG